MTVRLIAPDSLTTTKFGNVTVTGAAPSAESVERSVRQSSEALARLGERLAKPGIRLRPKKNVPLFWIDDDDPDLFVRRLNGRIERGRLVDGVFRVID
ncbi:hypothetical protein [uncultured Methylobacterium sp.]|jgi:hypothetical protein|uniref:hypothetical protein n=1 Tax=uncultured Methylobacterium sp. TaxID=157278 RepID=UPI0026225128|nr:hypothetical protein [uncultured Methylobacterium sp.]